MYPRPTPKTSTLSTSQDSSGLKCVLRNSLSCAGSRASNLSELTPFRRCGEGSTPKTIYPPLLLANDAIVLAYLALLPMLKVSLNSSWLFSLLRRAFVELSLRASRDARCSFGLRPAISGIIWLVQEPVQEARRHRALSGPQVHVGSRARSKQTLAVGKRTRSTNIKTRGRSHGTRLVEVVCRREHYGRCVDWSARSLTVRLPLTERLC